VMSTRPKRFGLIRGNAPRAAAKSARAASGVLVAAQHTEGHEQCAPEYCAAAFAQRGRSLVHLLEVDVVMQVRTLLRWPGVTSQRRVPRPVAMAWIATYSRMLEAFHQMTETEFDEHVREVLRASFRVVEYAPSDEHPAPPPAQLALALPETPRPIVDPIRQLFEDASRAARCPDAINAARAAMAARPGNSTPRET
jgi:hypothetical protein